MVEMLVVVAVLLVLAGISIPALTRAFATYQLNDAASRLAGTIKLARFEAIRVNKPVSCQIRQSGTGWVVYADNNGNLTPDPTETQDLIVSPMNLIGNGGGGIPDTAPIAASLGASGLPLTVISGVNGAVTFDQRGAVTTDQGGKVYVLYLVNSANADPGFRAVVVLPSGMVHVWRALQGGTWFPVS
jgi:type II secretory pathway pseudopilin PulG